MAITHGRCTGLVMAHLTLRIDDDLAVAVDALARAAGMTRSKWIGRAIIDALPARPDEVPVLWQHGEHAARDGRNVLPFRRTDD